VAVNGVLDPFDDYPVLMLLWLFAGISLNFPRISVALPLNGASIDRSAR
jgi:hypothetical protein